MKKNLLFSILFYHLFIPLYIIGVKVNSLIVIDGMPDLMTIPFMLLGICSLVLACTYLSWWLKFDTKYAKYSFFPIVVAVMLCVVFVFIVIGYFLNPSPLIPY